MPSVEYVHWNPVRRPAGRRFGRARPVDNFGDLLGPVVVRRMLERAAVPEGSAVRDARLLTVGSVLRLARAGDVVWGTGVNGKSLDAAYDLDDLDVRAVRGPRTQAFLAGRGVDVPAVHGDPGLLVGRLWTREELRGDEPTRPVTITPNLHDSHLYRRDPRALDPQSGLARCVRLIAASELVVGSSLHGIVIAESLGIPARLVQPGVEPLFKYADHYEGTGRPGWRAAPDVGAAIRMGGEEPVRWDPQPLLDAFPWDLWGRAGAPLVGAR